jgi:cytochrome b
MNRKPGKVWVWPLCTRIIHWMIALSFATSFITSLYEEWLDYHVAFGFIFGFMLNYRIIWGIIGPRYATFNTLKLKFSELKWYFHEKIIDRWRKIPPGHNPASSWFTILVLSLGYIIALSGVLLYGAQEGHGLFSFLNESYYAYSSLLLDIHVFSAYTLLVWVLIHISGVLIEQFYHKTSMFFAMITGYKKSEGEDTEMCPARDIFSYSVIILAFSILYFTLSHKENFLVQNRFTKTDYAHLYPIYHEKCGDCHKAYPPFMLPEQSWNRIISGLDNHFGEKITDANITQAEQNSIRNFLIARSAEHSSKEISFKVLETLGDLYPKSITKTPYWRETHAQIPPETYKRRSIKDKSNCFACHKDFEYGMMEDTYIKIPE